MSIRFRAVSVALSVAIAALTTLVLGCHRTTSAAPLAYVQTHSAQPAPATVDAADKRIADAQGRADQARRDLDSATAELRTLHADRDRLVVEAARARLAWTAGLLQLAVIGFGALAFFSPFWRTRLVLAAVSTEAAAVLALALRAVYAWLPYVGALVGLAFVAIAVWKTVKLVRAARTAADHGDRMEAALLGIREWFTGDESMLHELAASVKVESAKAQAAAGVGSILARIRGTDPKQSAAMAELPVLRAKVAELPAPRPVDLQPQSIPSGRVDLAPLIAKSDQTSNPQPPMPAKEA